jgi:catechol 2,3-dioxygenase-like lactoylglutathione lyase family enzyme
MTPLQPDGVLETALYADDLTRAEHFYGTIIGLEVDSRQQGRHVFFRCGRGMLLVFDARATQAAGPIPPHGATGPGHVAFSVAEDRLDDWAKHLRDHEVEIEAVIDWPGGERSLYFRDPAGNSLELASPGIWRGLADRQPQ